ncbi:MAG: asparagine synthase (glutamine-hydrolyzing) [Syntrophaceae bacterium]|nr:asparagine synthase (glutamine-hydrolyzing) [Syntrophaceae bacterium]
MCGFTGFINTERKHPDFGDIVPMTRVIRHRGPDDSGIALFSFTGKRIMETDLSEKINLSGAYDGAIGFNRLSILDLSRQGHQPMVDRDRKIILAFNGEIYNAPSYREFLKSKGFSFHSSTDTEVLLYLYIHLGMDGMLEKLNGMFAFCIVDLEENKIFLARDRIGIKPLYYFNDNKSFIFSSEVKSFLYNRSFKGVLDSGNIDEYTQYGFVAGSGTLLKNVFTLEPGHYLTLTDGSLNKHKYWEIYNGGEIYALGFNEAKSLLEQRLQESLRLQLLSDVKIGCQLSGGIDSSLITLITADNLKGYDLNSVSVLLEDENYSEEKWIDMVSGQTRISSHKYELTGDYFAENFKKATWHFDFPLRVPNSLGIFLLAEKAKELFTVFLSGEGADELFAGYERFFKGNVLSYRPLSFFLNKIPIYNQRFRNWSESRRFSVEDWYISVGSGLTTASVKQMKPDIDISGTSSRRRAIFMEGAGDFIHKAQRYELKTWLIDLLLRQDKMTMAHAVENRVPFLDHNLVDFTRKLPSSFLVKLGLKANRNSKIILKRIAEKHFGKKFAFRKKSGFELPLADFFMNKAFRSWMLDAIVPGIKSRGIFNAAIITDYFKDLSALNREQMHMLWILINFETWAQMFLSNEAQKA